MFNIFIEHDRNRNIWKKSGSMKLSNPTYMIFLFEAWRRLNFRGKENLVPLRLHTEAVCDCRLRSKADSVRHTRVACGYLSYERGVLTAFDVVEVSQDLLLNVSKQQIIPSSFLLKCWLILHNLRVPLAHRYNSLPAQPQVG